MADDTNPNVVVNMAREKDIIQKSRDKLEKEALCELHEAQQGPVQGPAPELELCLVSVQEDEGLESRPAGKDLGELVDEKLSMTQQYTHSPEGQPYPRLHQQKSGQQVKRGNFASLACGRADRGSS